MSSKLLSMLSNAEENFLSSILKDDKKLDDFVTSWTHISDAVMLAVNQNSLTNEALHMAQSVAARINILASSFLELSERTEMINQSLEQDLNSAFATLNLDDNQEAATPTARRLPSYVQAAHQWLLENIHNPYPTKTTKLQLSRQTSCPVKDIDSWFSAARKRIGWNNLRSSHFANNRAQIIAAATAFFKPINSLSNKSESVSYLSPVDAAFLEIEYNAKHLYDFIPDAKLSEPVRRRRRYPAYPSPEPSDRSNETSPEPDMLSSSSSHQTDTRKRKRSAIDDATESDFSSRKR
ncbi:homeobox KN domain-containing protein [Panaeolus papilionaceus]|nr:homeobox KN domain-containing protein [Panaeolus papilionaceus]